MATTSQFNIKINGTNQLVELNDILQTNVRSLQDLREQRDIIEQAFAQADFGTDSARQLQAALRDVNTQLKVIDESVSDLTIAEKFEGVARIGSAVGSAFALASQGVQLFGEENSKTAEEIQKAEQQLLFFIGSLQTVQIITESFSSKNKLFLAIINSITAAFNRAGLAARLFGTTTRVALTASGIGLVVVAIGLLIENFDLLKKKVQDVFGSLEPLFDNLRDFASFISFGFFDSAQTSKIKANIESIVKANEKVIADSQKRIEALQSRQTLGLESDLNKLNDILNLNVDTSKDVSNNIGRGITKLITDLNSNRLGLQINDQLTITNTILQDNIRLLNEGNLSAEQRVEIEQDLLNELETQLKFNNINRLSDEERKNILDAIFKFESDINKVQADRLKTLNDIAEVNKNIRDNNISISKITNDIANTDLTNFKSIVDLLSNLEVIPQRLFNDSNALKFAADEIKRLKQTLSEPLQKLFTDEFLSNLEKGSSFLFPDNATKGQITEFFDVLKNLYNENFKAEEINIKKSIESQKQLNNERVKNINLFERDVKQRAKNIEAITSSNRLLDADLLKQLNDLQDRQILINNEFEKNKTLVLNKNEIESLNRAEEAFNKSVNLLEKFKNGVSLTQDEIDKLNQGLEIFSNFSSKGSPIDFTENFSKKTIEEQNLLLKDFEFSIKKRFQDLLDFRTAITTQTAEEKALIKSIGDAINDIISKTKEQVNANNELKKSLQEQLFVLEKQNDITNAQAKLESTSGFSKRKELILDIAELQKQQIEDTFKRETQGLSEVDERYKLALENRNQSLIELDRTTQKSLSDNVNLSLSNIQNNINLVGSALNDIFGVFSLINQASIDDVNNRLTQVNEQLQITEERINFLDSLITEKQNLIKTLEQQAASAEGAQRQEILKQIDAEIERGRLLAKEKQKQAQAQTKILERQAELNEDNNRLQRESIKLQKQQALAANILAAAQAAVAITKYAAENTLLGPAGIVSLIAFGATLFATIQSARSLANSSPTESDNTVPITGGAKGGFPDGFEPMAVGGFTPTKGYGKDSTGEENVGLYRLHSNEWVAPRWMTESPKYRDTIMQLERDRQKGKPMATGGFANTNTTDMSNMEKLLLANLNKPIYVAVTDINDGQNRVQIIENRSKI